MVVIGLDTVLAFELEIAERPQSTQSYTSRSRVKHHGKCRPKSSQSGKSRSDSRLDDKSLTGLKIIEDNLTGSIKEQINLTGLKINGSNLTGSNQCESNLTGSQFLIDNLNGIQQNDNALTERKVDDDQTDCSKIESLFESWPTNQSSWLEERLSESVHCLEDSRPESRLSKQIRPESRFSKQARPESRFSNQARPESRLSDIFTRESLYVKKSRPKTGVERSRSAVSLKNRPKTSCIPNRKKSASSSSKPKKCLSLSRPRSVTNKYQGQPTGQIQYESKGPLEGDTTGLMGSSVGYMAGQPRTTWSMADSQIGMNNPMFGNVNTPRILELDINRMMIGQNTISAQIGSPGLSNDRLVNAANNNLRAYMTVNRPGPNSAGRSDRPHSGSRQSPRPASSPTNHSASTAKRVRLSDVEIPTVMTSSQPLPPIGMSQDKPKSGSTKGSRSPPRIPVGNELPESPPGSSLRHSPPGMEDTEVTSPVK